MDLQRPHHRTALLGAEVVHDITSARIGSQPSSTKVARLRACCWPFAAIPPISARLPRSAFMNCVRWPLSVSRIEWTVLAA